MRPQSCRWRLPICCCLLLLLSLLLLQGVVLVQDDDELNAQEPAAQHSTACSQHSSCLWGSPSLLHVSLRTAWRLAWCSRAPDCPQQAASDWHPQAEQRRLSLAGCMSTHQVSNSCMFLHTRSRLRSLPLPLPSMYSREKDTAS